MKVRFFIFEAVALFFLFSTSIKAQVQVPNLRLKTGIFLTSVSAGDAVVSQPLNSSLTFQPTILWDLNSFGSRVGIHYIGDFDSDFGMIPISGLGFSGYFYPYGISSSNLTTDDNITIQKHKTSPYVYGGLTPTNFNLNKTESDDPDNPITFSSLIFEVSLGIGVDYPLRANTLLSVEMDHRFGSADENQGKTGNLRYSATGIMFSFTTSYF